MRGASLLHIQRTLESYLADIAGMDAVTLQPAAGAHGELTGLLMIRSFSESQGSARRTVLIPDSATVRIRPQPRSQVTRPRKSPPIAKE